MKISIQPTRPPRVEMLPLIDIVFLLLVFFIYAMLSMAVHRGLPIQLPESSQVKPDRTLTLAVTVKSDGSLYLDKQPVTLKDLPEILKTRTQGAENPGVLLFGDRDVPYQRLFEVLDSVRESGLTRVSLQADRPSDMP